MQSILILCPFSNSNGWVMRFSFRHSQVTDFSFVISETLCGRGAQIYKIKIQFSYCYQLLSSLDALFDYSNSGRMEEMNFY